MSLFVIWWPKGKSKDITPLVLPGKSTFPSMVLSTHEAVRSSAVQRVWNPIYFRVNSWQPWQKFKSGYYSWVLLGSLMTTSPQLSKGFLYMHFFSRHCMWVLGCLKHSKSPPGAFLQLSFPTLFTLYVCLTRNAQHRALTLKVYLILTPKPSVLSQLASAHSYWGEIRPWFQIDLESNVAAFKALCDTG